MDISKKILIARKKKGFTQESLADATNLSLSTIQRIEKGKVIPRSHTLKSISDVLGIELLNHLSSIKSTKVDWSDWSILLLASFIFVVVPPLNIIFLLGIWSYGMNQDLPSLVIKKILRFQITSFLILVFLMLMIPLISYALTGQKTYGQINLPFFLYLFYLFINIAVPSIIYRQSSLNVLESP